MHQQNAPVCQYYDPWKGHKIQLHASMHMMHSLTFHRQEINSDVFNDAAVQCTIPFVIFSSNVHCFCAFQSMHWYLKHALGRQIHTIDLLKAVPWALQGHWPGSQPPHYVWGWQGRGIPPSLGRAQGLAPTPYTTLILSTPAHVSLSQSFQNFINVFVHSYDNDSLWLS